MDLNRLNLIQGMFHHHPGKSGTGHLKSNGGNGKKRRGKMGNKMGIMKLNYVNITAKDCDGWLNQKDWWICNKHGFKRFR
jgi:hypothetical protein